MVTFKCYTSYLNKEYADLEQHSPREESIEAGNHGGDTNNIPGPNAGQARKTCVLCNRLLGRIFYWPEQWRHRTRNDIKMKCKECSPISPKGQPSGYQQLNEKRSREAAAKPFTCQVCEQIKPRTQFRVGKNGKFDLRKPKTCEQCRAEGKLPTCGWKKRAAAGPLTCHACKRTLPRTQFQVGKHGRFDLRNPQNCKQCRAETGKLHEAVLEASQCR